MLFERIRVVTLPRRLIHGYFRVFGPIMIQVIAKHEGERVRIRRKVVSYIKWPFLEISTLNSKFSRPPKRILKAVE